MARCQFEAGSNSDVVRRYRGLLVQGKGDFDAVENLRGDKFFKKALGIGLLPSSPPLRQRLDAQAGAMFERAPGTIKRLLGHQRPDYGVLACWRAVGCRCTWTPSRWTTVARPGKAWVALTPVWTVAAHWRPGWATSRIRKTAHCAGCGVAQAVRVVEGGAAARPTLRDAAPSQGRIHRLAALAQRDPNALDAGLRQPGAV